MIKPNSKSPLGLLFRSSSPFHTIGVVRLWNLSVFLQEFSSFLFGKQFEVCKFANCKSGILLWKLSGSSRFCKCPMNQSSRNILVTSTGNKQTSCFYIFFKHNYLIYFREVKAGNFIIVLTIQFTTLQFKVDRELDSGNATANFPSKKDPWGSR